MRKVPGDRVGEGRRWLPICGLLLLSLLWAMGWVRADLSPGMGAGLKVNPLLGEAALLALFAVLAGLAALTRRSQLPDGGAARRALLVGVGLFVVPAVLTSVATGRVDDATRVAVFSLTPLFAVVFEPHISIGTEQYEGMRGGFAAAMLGVAGTLLVFPVDLPHSFASAFALGGLLTAAASVAAANCASVRELRGGTCSALWFGSLAAGSAALLIAAFAQIFHESSAAGETVSTWAVADLVALALLFWLMRKMSAVQMTTRFLIAPLLANLISIALLLPHVEIQAWIGLLMIAAGAGWMLSASADPSATTHKTLELE